MPDTIQLHCRKCKKKQTVENPEIVTTKNNRRAGKGKCPICGSKLFGFLPKIKQDKPTSTIDVKVAQGENIKKGDAIALENGKATKATKAKKQPTIEEEIAGWDEIQN